MAAPPGGVPLTAAMRAALRESVAAALLKVKAEGAAEAAHWRGRALAAEADALALREGLLAELQLERRAAVDLPEALRAVCVACRPLALASSEAEDEAQRQVHFLRQGARLLRGSHVHVQAAERTPLCHAARIVQTVRSLCGGGARAATAVVAGAGAGAPGRSSPQEVAAFVVELLTSMARSQQHTNLNSTSADKARLGCAGVRGAAQARAGLHRRRLPLPGSRAGRRGRGAGRRMQHALRCACGI
jgi:hypothetical protein